MSEQMMNTLPFSEAEPMAPATDVAVGITRGVCRLLVDLGYRPLTEFKLKSGRRADVMALNGAGRFLIVEVKSSVEDFRADRKWPEYRPFCDSLYFAVDARFPTGLLPADCGVLVADPFQAEILRRAPVEPMHATRRKAQTLRFGLTAAQRLHQVVDPAG